MYSIVLVAAMTAAPATPDWGFNKGGCYGCNGGGCNGGGCYGGGCWSSCGGGCGGGCYGGSCGGGGFCGLFSGGGFCGFFSGGCHGSASCHGCCGGYPAAPYASLAFGGCCGGHAPYYTGCMGYGSYTPGPTMGVGYGVGGVGGPVVTPAGGYVTPMSGTGTPGAGSGTGGTGTPGSGAGSPGGPGGISVPGTPILMNGLPVNRGQVVVLAPANAKLFADGEATSLTGTERVFLTPELSAGRDFEYTLKVENGTETTTRQAVVRAGHRTVVDFTSPVGEKVSTPVTINLPAKARLFVDGVPAATAGGTHSFRTPELAKGKPFVYEFRAEVDRDGKTEVQSKKVTFNAGEPVTVDFNEPAAVRTALK